MGTHFSIISPAALFPDEELRDEAKQYAAESGARITVTDIIDKEIRGADAVYTDVWVSMGEEDKLSERIAQLTPYRVTGELMEKTGNPGAIFLHCLPAVKGNEVTTEVFESACSRVFEEAENRKHTIKALMIATL